jgi:hypothetical protein
MRGGPGGSMKQAFITCWFIAILITISCTGYATQPECKSARPAEAIENRCGKDPTGPSKGEQNGYAPAQVLVRFKEGTQPQEIEAIQRELHLQTLRIVSKPNLYLMKILDGFSVQEIVSRLKGFKAVEYAEPNYMRTTQ